MFVIKIITNKPKIKSEKYQKTTFFID